MRSLRSRQTVPFIAVSALAGGLLALAQDETKTGEWRSSGGDSAYMRYSPLAQIDRNNVKNLKVLSIRS
jgi:glucose dehydrogenase